MNTRILFAAAAAIALAGCNRPESGSEKEKNESGEVRNKASAQEEPASRDEGTREERAEGEERASEEPGASQVSSGEEFGSRLRGASGRGAGGGGGGGGEEPDLREALQLAAREQRARLPLRDGITTVYDVSAEGTEFVVSLRIGQDFTDAQFERLEQAFRRNSCQGDAAELIRLGATTTYRVTDSAGERRSFSFDRC